MSSPFDFAYANYFPDIENVYPRYGNGDSVQGATLLLSGDRVLRTLEIEVQRRFYPNLVFHLYTDPGFQPGWIHSRDPLDYLAYRFLDTKVERAFLFPWHMLYHTFRVHEEEWMKHKDCKLFCSPRKQGNVTYETAHFLAVPITMVQAAMMEVIYIKPTKTNTEEAPALRIA